MAVNETQLVQLFEQVLTLSKVDASQSVAILKSHYSDARTVRAATDAALRLGAKVYAVELPAFNHPRAMGNDMTAYCGDTALTGNLAAQRALEAADLLWTGCAVAVVLGAVLRIVTRPAGRGPLVLDLRRRR